MFFVVFLSNGKLQTNPISPRYTYGNPAPFQRFNLSRSDTVYSFYSSFATYMTFIPAKHAPPGFAFPWTWRRSELIGLGEVDDGAGGGGRDDDVVGDGLEARDDPLGEERAHGEAEEDEEDVRGGPAEGEAVHLEDTRCDLLELLRGQVRAARVGLLRLQETSNGMSGTG